METLHFCNWLWLGRVQRCQAPSAMLLLAKASQDNSLSQTVGAIAPWSLKLPLLPLLTGLCSSTLLWWEMTSPKPQIANVNHGGLTQVTFVTLTATLPLPVCADHPASFNNCRYITSGGSARCSLFRWYSGRFCRRTCGYCSVFCADRYRQDFCSNWRARGFCTTNLWVAYYACFRTCGLCY